MVKLQIIVGSIRANRQGLKVAQWIYQQLKNYAQKDSPLHSELSGSKTFKAELLDLKEWNLPMYDEPEPPIAKKWMKKVAAGDGYIIVTPEYNHGYPASLKNALDYPYEEWNRKPVGFVSYSAGRGAGIRAVEQLRLVSIELQMVTMRQAIHIPFIKSSFDENGPVKDPDKMEAVAREFFEELLWWVKALKEARSSS